MENRRTYVLSAAFVAAFLFSALPTYAYQVNTHAYLTSEAIEFYNKTAKENTISSNWKRFMIDGAINEDNDPRYLNHFYDPINNEGLDDGWFGGQSVKEWANDSEHQGKLGYTLLSDSLLASVDKQKIEQFYPTSDFTWDAGIRYWLNGDKEMAMVVLGHILHLVEDMGVPEHTRNNSHSDGSEYEEYASRYNANTPDEQLRTRTGDKPFFIEGSLGDYFDGLAKYSNKYFYSPGSISTYGYPELDYRTAEVKDRVYFISNKDDEGNKYYVAAKKNIANIAIGNFDVSVADDAIKESYWNLLSVRTVRYSAGVIDLFFRDVERRSGDASFLKEKQTNATILGSVSTLTSSLWSGMKSVAVKTGTFFGNVFSAIGDGLVSAGSFVGGLFTNDSGLTEVDGVDVNDSASFDVNTGDAASAPAAPTAEAIKKDALAKKNAEIAALEMQLAALKKEAQMQDAVVLSLEKKQAEPVVEKETVETKTIEKKVVVDAPFCAYVSGNNNGQKNIVINEVAWMGGVRSASDEWIELKNVSGSVVDVSEWQLLNKGGGIKIRLGDLKSTLIKPGEFVLLERTDNNSAVGATADLIYSGALGNTNDGLQLLNASCAIVDSIAVTAKWSAGNNDTKQTMERSGNSWHTSISSGGTPKKENSSGVVYSGGGGSSIATQSTGQGGDPLSAAPQFYPIVINEIMYSLDGTDSGREWVELYNSGTTAVDINDWKLFENDTNHGLTVAQGSGTIPAGGYAVVVDDKTSFLVDNAGFSGTIFDSTFSLSDSGESLTLKNSTLTIDTYTYASSTGADGNGMSLQRFSDGWFAASTTPGSLNIKNTAIAAETEETVATTTESTAASTSTLLWDGGSQSGVVFDLLATDFVGQRVSFATAVTVGSLEFGYYNDYGAGSTEVKIFSETGVERFATTLAVPTLRYGGYITHVLTEPLQLTAGDYFIGSRLVSGNIGIRKGTKANVCAKAVYASGVIPACGTGDDVSMRINTWTAEAATTSSATTTAEIATTTAATSTATSTQPSSDATAGEATPQFHPVVINEIMYDVDGSDDNREWIEVYNAGTSSVDIADWKFFEGDTHHGLSVTQGSSLLASNGYAVIVANPVAFLSDNASFSGTIFDSSFSLNKTGETLVLKNGDLAIDTVAYIAGTSTNGTGMSLQRFSDGWSGASTTPGTINVLQPIVIVVEEATSTATTTPAETATSTDPVDATPPPITTLTQSNSEAKSASEIIKSYLQGIGMNKMGSVKTIKVYGEGALGQWKGGICQSTSASQCDTTKPKHLVYSQETITTSEVKSLLTFNFSSVVTLDADTSYYVFLEPPFTSDLKKQHSSVYGASDNVYLDGGLRSMDFGLDGYPGIKDMYFEIQ